MSNYTKGPWRIEENSLKGDSKGYYIHQKDRLFHRPLTQIMCANIADISKEEVEANAKLIACAPEMIETLIDILRILELKPSNDNLYQRNKIKSLIKKATT